MCFIGYVCLIGALAPASLFTGYDTAGHVAEETHVSHISTPRAMFLAVCNALVLGLVLIVGINFCITDYDALTGDATPSHASYVILWEQTVGPKVAVFFLVILFVGIECSNCANLTSASRMIYALARDDALPFSKHLYHMDLYLGGPVRSIWAALLLCFILALPGVGSESVLSALFSLTATGLYTSYAIPIFLRVTIGCDTFCPAEWSLGSYSYPMSCFAVVWCAFMVVILCLPTSADLSVDTFNYSPIALGAVIFLATVAWVFSARFWFKGTLSNIDGDGGAKTDKEFTIATATVTVTAPASAQQRV